LNGSLMPMRVLVFLAVVCLVASAGLAPGTFLKRPGSLPLARILDADPQERARLGLAEKRLGAALAGFEDQVVRDPANDEALRQRIRVGITIGAVAFGQPGLNELVRFQVQSYLEHRRRIDPTGSFLQGVLREFVDHRLHFDWSSGPGFYACTSTALWLAARGDPAGGDMLDALTRQGDFHLELFPYLRRYRPGWLAVQPLIVHYLEQGDLVGRIEAGVTLLEYHVLFGVGKEEVDRFLPEIRAAIKEVRGGLRSRSLEPRLQASGRTAIWGMGLLAAMGNDLERDLLDRKDTELGMLYIFADCAQMARLVAGLGDFEMYLPNTQRFLGLDPIDQPYLFVAAALRATVLKAQGQEQTPAFATCRKILEAAFDAGPFLPMRVFSMQVLSRLDPALGKDIVRRAINEGGTMSVFGTILSDSLEDEVPLLLPAVESPEPDISSIAAVSLLTNLEGRAIMR